MTLVVFKKKKPIFHVLIFFEVFHVLGQSSIELNII